MILDGGNDVAPVLDGEARALYLTVLEHGGRIPATDLTVRDRPALQRLLELGLIVQQVGELFYAAVSPRAVGARLSADLRATGTRLLAQADALPPVLSELTQAYDALPPRPEERGLVQYLDDLVTIEQRIVQLEAESDEVLTAQPGGARSSYVLESSAVRVPIYLARGGVLRTIYQPGAWADPPTARYADRMTRLGARYRVLDEPYHRMLIFNRSVAVIPVDTAFQQAAFVEDPFMVSCLVDLFERDWQRAERVRWDVDTPPAAIDRVGRLLAQGLTQRAIASRLGLSERTVAAQIARLREEYDAETLFQLGWQMRGQAVRGA